MNYKLYNTFKNMTMPRLTARTLTKILYTMHFSFTLCFDTYCIPCINAMMCTQIQISISNKLIKCNDVYSNTNKHL